MRSSGGRKRARRHDVFAALFACAVAALTGARLTPVVQPVLEYAGVGAETVLFGNTLSFAQLAATGGYAVVFLSVFAVTLLLLQEGRHVRDRTLKTALVLAAVLAISGYFFWRGHKGALVAQKDQPAAYKPDDRQKLERLIHEESKND